MRDRIDIEIVDLLEGRPDPLRRGRALVADMHADQPDRHLALDLLAVGPWSITTAGVV
jgi:hypothetical protein